jgi:hypothetical protein
MEYDYSPTRAGDIERSLTIECPCCEDGTLEVTVEERSTLINGTKWLRRVPGKIVTTDCAKSCENDIANGKADEAILEAIAQADKFEANKDWSKEWNARYAEGSTSAQDSIERMRDARRYK